MARLALAAAVGVGAAWEYDRRFCYARCTRNARSVVAAARTLWAYKYDWRDAETLEDQNAIHDRVARDECKGFGPHRSL